MGATSHLRTSWTLLRDSLWINVRESLGTQSYYALGLGIQKGLPFLLIPLVVRLYGDHTYASYVLFYASVQVFANLFSLAVPHSVITYWYQEKDKTLLSWTYLSFLALAHLVLGSLLSVGVFSVYERSFGAQSAWRITVLGLLFTFVYNLNIFLTGVCRARNYAKGYFYAQGVAATALILGLFALRRSDRVESLIALFMLSVILQDVYLLGGLREHLRWPSTFVGRALLRRILSYSVPLVFHLELTLLMFWIDKYLVRLYFPAAEFSQFTISFQYAFGQSLFSQLFALHTFPLICRLVAEEDETKLRSVLLSYNFLLAALGTAWIAVVLFTHWTVMPLGIAPRGFFIMAVGFLFWNLASNYINVLWARLRTAPGTISLLVSVSAFVLLLWLGCHLRTLVLCYVAHLVCAAIALLLFVLLERIYRTISARGVALLSTTAQEGRGPCPQ